MTVKAIPDGYHSITPYLSVDGVAEAIEFYRRAFGAVELFRLTSPDGKIGHAEIRIDDSPRLSAPGRGWSGRWKISFTANARAY